ncbi:hypothetical protein POV27_11310 [Aureisphaera galaxeae]|uniref:leucine-rich repeat domain-containing protein n=1 Tax=Aureisphaera galaxeae TaxID=1538023 RepID=UPI00234FEB65|nr:hypothetical protein [Aureisphaera galaxeae]MDC8004639.1 hypothetical protein [Aureisphaera galaxeae]
MKRRLTILFTLLVTLQVFAQVPNSELQAMKDLYAQTQGDSWNQKWDLNEPVENWPGVTVVDNHVTEIRMLFNNLNGELPNSLEALTELKVLELSFNKISGSLPESLGNLEKLEILALNGNSLSGEIPVSIGNLTSLKQLHVSSNQLTGTIPYALENLTSLEVFNVFDNNLIGNVPLGLGKIRTLREFMVAENNFVNASEISTILLANSANINLNGNTLNPSAKSIIAIETSDDDN